jgi:hypothetical protein
MSTLEAELQYRAFQMELVLFNFLLLGRLKASVCLALETEPVTRLVMLELLMGKAEKEQQILRQHRTMPEALATKVLSESRCTTKKLLHNSNSQE